VARVNRRSAGFLKDALAARALGSKRLPVPQVLLVDDIGGAALCVSRRAPGVRVQDLSPAGAAALVPALLGVLEALAAASPPGSPAFGPLDATGLATCETWRDYLLGGDDPSLADNPVARAAIEAVRRLAPSDARPRRLIHGDFRSANLISDGGRITAVIDWDRAMAGDPDYDAANVLFWREPSLAALAAFLDAGLERDRGRRGRMLCYQLRIGLEEFAEALEGVTPVDAGWVETRLTQLVAAAGEH
jgi:hygromycin-B 4-O-kinase